MIEHSENRYWYVACCKPRQEVVAEENLLRQGFDVYLPRMKMARRRRGQWLDTIEVLFPRYIFICLNPLLRSTASVRSTRGVVDLVRFGGQPAKVPGSVIDALLRRANSDSGLHEDIRPLFNEGDLIRLVDGPLSGMEAVFAEQDGGKRVSVLLELLGKAHKVQVSRDWVAQAA